MSLCSKSFLQRWTTLVWRSRRIGAPLQGALPLPFLSATDAHFHRAQPIAAQHPAGSDVGNLSAPPTPLKVNGTALG